jgi:hypothetical protein
MRTRVIALLLALLPAAAAAQDSATQPTCKADRTGDQLLTTVNYPDGFTVEAPWRILDVRAGVSTGDRNISVLASLDRVIEYNPVRKERVATPFPSSVEIVFEADSEDGILETAAQVWCATVAKVRSSIPGKVQKAIPMTRMSALPASARAAG